MDDDRDRIAENRARWEELAAIHPETEFYDVEAFLAGESSLYPLERAELGDAVGAGTTLLHLQCHFGLDTLSWAREGAEVVGVDFAETAIERARALAAEAGLADRAEFVRSDVYEVPDRLDRAFEVVFSSYGTVYWLPDVDRWAEVVAACLDPGGVFYLAESHPFTRVFGEETTAERATLRYPYFGDAEPITVEEGGSYAAPDADLEHARSHGWAHGLGEIVTALLDAGLRLEFLHEHPWSEFRALDAMEADEAGRWWLPGLEHDLPFVFSLRARKPA